MQEKEIHKNKLAWFVDNLALCAAYSFMGF